MLKKYFIYLFILISLISFGFPKDSGAQSATLYFSPASGTFEEGKSFWLAIMVNTGGEAVNAVAAYLSYPQDKLEALGVDTTGSVMEMWAEKNAASGKIEIAGGSPTPGFSGIKKIASVGFKVKDSSGSVNLKFSEDSAVLTDAENKNIFSLASSGQGNYSFEPKTVSPTTPTTPTSPTSPTTPTTPTTPDTPATSTPPLGYRVEVIILNSVDNQPLPDAEVNFPDFSQGPQTTNQEGKVVFDNLSLGKQQVAVRYQNTSLAYELDILDKETTQRFEILFEIPNIMDSLPFLIGITVLFFCLSILLILKIFNLWIFSERPQESKETNNLPPIVKNY